MRRQFLTAARRRALGVGAALLVLSGCTWFDDHLPNFPGTPFTPDQPEGEVLVVGEIAISAVEKGSEGCVPGGTLFWGMARNTGDVDLNDVRIDIDARDAAGTLLGTFSGSVFNGTVDVDDTDPDNPIVRAQTSLEVDQSGTFSVCSPLPFGSVASADYRTRFVVAPIVE